MTKDFKKFSFDTSHLEVNPAAKNLAASQNDYAVFLPSISAIYARIVSMTEYVLRNKLPDGLVNGMVDLNFLDPKTSLFYYPTALYSAGHAVLDPKESWTIESMIQQRDRKNTVILGDSGGFQASTGVLKFPWTAKPNQTVEEHNLDKDAVRMKILRWLEATADYSMVLDWPTGTLSKSEVDPVTGVSLHPGLKTFRDCLDGSVENHKFFLKHRQEGATKFLNVLQGRNVEEGDIWWDEVKDLPFESWAFSGVQASNFAINLRRLIIMRDNHYLENREWLHYLGNGKIKAGCALTTLQRVLRKYVDEQLTLSFDAASPFVMTAKGQAYHTYELSSNNIAFKGGTMPDQKELKNNPQLLNDWIKENLSKNGNQYRSRIGDQISVGDICIKGYEDLQYKKIPFSKKEIDSGEWAKTPEGMANDRFKWSKAYKNHLMHHFENDGLFDWGHNSSVFDDETKKYEVKWPSSMDGFSYLLIMNHNVELHINAIQAACMIQDQSLSEAKKYLTPDLLEFKDLCTEIFTSERPMEIISKHERMLQLITGMDATNDISINLDSI